jgi:hypothetical protein
VIVQSASLGPHKYSVTISVRMGRCIRAPVLPYPRSLDRCSPGCAAHVVIQTLVSEGLYILEIERIAVASYPGSCGIMSSEQQIMKSRDCSFAHRAQRAKSHDFPRNVDCAMGRDVTENSLNMCRFGGFCKDYRMDSSIGIDLATVRQQRPVL